LFHRQDSFGRDCDPVGADLDEAAAHEGAAPGPRGVGGADDAGMQHGHQRSVMWKHRHVPSTPCRDLGPNVLRENAPLRDTRSAESVVMIVPVWASGSKEENPPRP